MKLPTPKVPASAATATSASEGRRAPDGWLWISTDPFSKYAPRAGTVSSVPLATTSTDEIKPEASMVPIANTSAPKLDSMASRRKEMADPEIRSPESTMAFAEPDISTTSRSRS